MQCVGRGDHAGLATSNTNLYDEQGLFGHSSLSAMTNPIPKALDGKFV
jgi:hypothetical protein